MNNKINGEATRVVINRKICELVMYILPKLHKFDLPDFSAIAISLTWYNKHLYFINENLKKYRIFMETGSMKNLKMGVDNEFDIIYKTSWVVEYNVDSVEGIYDKFIEILSDEPIKYMPVISRLMTMKINLSHPNRRYTGFHDLEIICT
jgi:hypothetical protein